MIFWSDIDGTVGDDQHRKHYVEGDKPDFDTYHEQAVKDNPHDYIMRFLRSASAHGHAVVFVTERPEKFRETTQKWLEIHMRGSGFTLMMRPDNEFMPSTELKIGWLTGARLGGAEPSMVIEDNDATLRAFQREGVLTVDAKLHYKKGQ